MEVGMMGVGDETEEVCLSCLKWFDVKPNVNRILDVNNQHPILHQRFIYFAKEHLKCTTEVIQMLSQVLLRPDNSQNSFEKNFGQTFAGAGKSKSPVFCGDCENIVIIICNLFDGLCAVKAKLAENVGKLGSLLERASKQGSSVSADNWNQALLQTVTDHFGLGEVEGGKEAIAQMRNQLAENCKLESIFNVTPPFNANDLINGTDITRLPPLKQPQLPTLRPILPKQISVIPIPPPPQGSSEVVLPPTIPPFPIKIIKVHSAATSKTVTTSSITTTKGPKTMQQQQQNKKKTKSKNKECSFAGSDTSVVIKRDVDIINLEDETEDIVAAASASAVKESIQAKLPIDIEVVEPDSPSSMPATITENLYSNSFGRGKGVIGTPANYRIPSGSPGSYLGKTSVNYYDGYEDINSLEECIDSSMGFHNENSNSSSTEYLGNFGINTNETIIINPNQRDSFIDESENYNYEEEDDSCDEAMMSLPLDVTIEEVDEEDQGYSDTGESSLNSIRIVGISGASGTSLLPPQEKKRRRLPSVRSSLAVSMITDEDVPSEIPKFVDFFKKRRRELGLTQSDVSRSLGNMYCADNQDELFSQTTVSRFEAMNLTVKNMEKLFPFFRRWVLDIDPSNAAAAVSAGADISIDNTTGIPRVEKRRKRTTLDREALEFMEHHFQQEPRPTSEDISALATCLKLEKEVVRVWFCNRRQKNKKAVDGSRQMQQSYSGNGKGEVIRF